MTALRRAVIPLCSLSCACLIGLTGAASAQASYKHTCETAHAGAEQSWTSAGTWVCTPSGGSGIPEAGDEAIIKPGAQLVDSTGGSVGELEIQAGGALDLYGSSLSVESLVLGSSAPGTATLESLSGSAGTVDASTLAQFGNATVSEVNISVTGGQTVFEGGSPAVTSTWNGSALTVSGGEARFVGTGGYDLTGVKPTIDTAVSVEGTEDVSSGLDLHGPGTLTFKPSAPGSASSASMLTLGALEVSGAESVAVAPGFTTSPGQRVNLISAPAAGIAALGAPDTSVASFATDEAGTRLYFTVPTPTPPTLSLGAASPSHPHAGESVTVPISATGASSVSCTVDRASVPCTSSALTFTAPEAYGANVSVSASNPFATVTRTIEVPVPWLPGLVEPVSRPSSFLIFGLTQATIGWENEPTGSIECAKISGASPFETSYLSELGSWTDGAFSLELLVVCNADTNGIGFFGTPSLSSAKMLVVPTAYGTFDVWVTPPADSEAVERHQERLRELGGVMGDGPLTCPTIAGAQGYAWLIDYTEWKATKAPELPAAEVPKNATVGCAAITANGMLMSATVLVENGVRIAASASTEEEGATVASAAASATSARASHRRGHRRSNHGRHGAKRVKLTIRASARAKVQLLAYNTTMQGSGKTAKTIRKLAYRRIVKIKRGRAIVRFGAKLRASGFLIVLRVPHRKHAPRGHRRRRRAHTHARHGRGHGGASHPRYSRALVIT